MLRLLHACFHRRGTGRLCRFVAGTDQGRDEHPARRGVAHLHPGVSWLEITVRVSTVSEACVG